MADEVKSAIEKNTETAKTVTAKAVEQTKAVVEQTKAAADRSFDNTVAAVKTKNVPAEPISSARAGIRVARLTANPTTARANATNTATSDGALPISSQ